MWTVKELVFGERSVTKVAGLFASQPDAAAAVQDLLKETGLQPGQVRLLSPTDSVAVRRDVFERAVEPEEPGIWHTIIRAHVTMGLIGLLAGLILYGVMTAAGHPTVRASPAMSLAVFAGFGATFGLLLGGALALRPDHGWLFALIRKALQKGQWVVVAHPVNAGQTHKAVDVLSPGSLKVWRSF